MDQNNEDNQGINLSGRLKDSSNVVKFDNEWQSPTRSFHTEKPKIIQWVIKYSAGLVKDENQANYVLLGFAMVAIIISLFLFFGGNKAGVALPYEKTYHPTELQQ